MPTRKRKARVKPKETLKAQGQGWVKIVQIKKGDEEYLELRLRFKEYKEMKLKEED